MKRFHILVPHPEHESPGLWCWRDEWHATGQSAFALLAKFQRLNALSCTGLADCFGRREGRRSVSGSMDLRDARQFDVRRLTDVLRLPLEDIARAFVMPSHLAHVFAVPTLRWCARCAREGVHLTVFQLRTCRYCPVHHTPLEECCPQCALEIPFRLRPDVFRAPFSCPSCGTPWIAPSRGLDDLRVDGAYRRLLSRWAAGQRRVLQGGPQTDPMDGVWNVRRPEEREVSGYASCTMFPDATAGDDELLTGARSCYKAIRRWVMREYGGQHHVCIASATHHLRRRMDGRSTPPFCPVAQAVLRWRTKWEGFGVPEALLHPPLHGPLGIVVWLSRYAPIAPGEWSESTSRWLTLHLFAIACLDSFHTFLHEAQQARSHERIVWWPFPVHDFPQREVVAGGRDRPDDPAQFRLMSLELKRGIRVLPSTIPGGLVHEKHHARLLFAIGKAGEGPASSLSPRPPEHVNQPTAPGCSDSAVLPRYDACPVFAPANTVEGDPKSVVAV